MLTVEEIYTLFRTIERAYQCRICIIDGAGNHLFSRNFPEIDTTHLAAPCQGIDKTSNPGHCRKCDDIASIRHGDSVKNAFWKICPYGYMEIVGTIALPEERPFQLFAGIFTPRHDLPETAMIYPRKGLSKNDVPLRNLSDSEFASLPVLMNLLTREITELFLFQKQHEKEITDIRQFIEDYINSSFRDPLCLPDLAGKLGWTTSHTAVRIRRIFGKTFITLLNERRLVNVKWLLRNHVSFSIAKVAYVSGFRSMPYFHRVFQRVTGMTPLQYRVLNGKTVIPDSKT